MPRVQPRQFRNARRRDVGPRSESLSIGCVISKNGELRPLTDKLELKPEERGQHYSPVVIGKPIIVRYKGFFLRLENTGRREQQVMVSTFVKSEEKKKAAAEAVNYYDPKALFDNETLQVFNFGGENYGHELIYYNKSYLGESLRLTTSIMEIDNHDSKFKAVAEGIQSIGGLPFFLEYLPVLSIAKNTTNLLSKIIKILDKDDAIIPGNDLDLHFEQPHSNILQSGRYVCVLGRTPEELVAGGYELMADNRLFHQGAPYTDTSYFVMQVNSERHRGAFENFDYFHNAAELLALKNSERGVSEIIEVVSEGLSALGDYQVIDEIDELKAFADEKETAVEIKALFAKLSPTMAEFYKPYYDKIAEKFPSGT